MNPPDEDTKTEPAVKITEVEPGHFVRISKNSKYVIEYKRNDCIGAGTCTALARNTFQMNLDDPVADMISTDVEDSDEELLAAAYSCPVFAIIVKDAETGKQIFPPELIA